MYDVIVVGARCAGAPTAMLLARKGYRVLLLDKAVFPSDTLSTHFILYPGILCLQRWGLLERVLASGCPPLHKWTLYRDDFPLSGYPLASRGLPLGCSPRRTVLDTLLVKAAVEAGAELREGVVVQDVLWERERASGIRGRSPGGAVVSAHAPLIIGADGMRSQVARAVQAPAYHTRPTRTCAYYTYWADVPMEGIETYDLGPQRRSIVAFPTHDGLVTTYLGWPRSEFAAVRADIAGQVWRTLDQVPALAERLRAGRRAERFRGRGDLPNFFRRPYGPGWALVGDAGLHCDPIHAQGMQNAFCSVELLVEAIEAGFSGRQALEEALAGYERRRNDLFLQLYEATCQAAELAPDRISEEERRVRAAVRGDQEATNSYLWMWYLRRSWPHRRPDSPPVP